jgi:hypothetical protein
MTSPEILIEAAGFRAYLAKPLVFQRKNAPFHLSIGLIYEYSSTGIAGCQ